jgi:hypothetical protein
MTQPAIKLAEADFQQQVTNLADLLGWHIWHDPDPRPCPRCGLTVPDGREPGFSDLMLVRGATLLFVELKGDGGKATPEQEAFIERMKAVKFVAADIAWPKDWPALEDALRRAVR